MLQALIFDVDGTLSDTESTHLRAFNQAFAELNLTWHWSEEEYKGLLKISGGKERLTHYWQAFDPLSANSDAGTALIRNIHARKTECYARFARDGQLVLRPGVLELIRYAITRNLKLAIATTTTPENIDALLLGPLGANWRKYFAVVEDAQTAPLKKPHPQAYEQAIARLAVPPENCLAFEDSENGLSAAVVAGLRTVITPTVYTAGQDFSSAWIVLQDLTPMPELIEQLMNPNYIDLP